MKNTKEYFMQEKNDISDRIATLKEFLSHKGSSDRFASHQRNLMEKQLKAMEEYLSLLSERLFYIDAITDIETKIDFNVASAKAASKYSDDHQDTTDSTSDIFLNGVNWALKYLNANGKLTKSRKQVVNDAIDALNGKMASVLYFDSEEYGYIDYWYDEATDSLATEYISLPLYPYKDEEFNADMIDDLLDKLEDMLIKHFKEEKGIDLRLFED